MSTAEHKQRFSFAALKRNHRNPHALYNELRATAPLYFDSLSECWIVTGYAEVVAILEDERFTSDLGTFAQSAMSWDFAQHMLSQSLFFKEGPQSLQANHYLLKHIARHAKRLGEEMRAIIEKHAALVARQGRMDLIQDFSAPVSFSIILKLLGLDIPGGTLFQPYLHSAEALSDISSGYPAGQPGELNALVDFFRQQTLSKQKAPGDDLIDAFLKAPDIFPDQEAVVGSAMIVLSAGFVTTKKLIGSGVGKLLDLWPDLQSAYEENAALPRILCEELLRMSPPTRYIVRWAREDADLTSRSGVAARIRRGQKILLFLEAANYDPACFSQPETFNLERHSLKHLTFGHGRHRCPGASIARLEAHAALHTLLQLSHLAPDASTPPTWNPNPNLGGFRSFPVVFDPY
jgi:cytochrome P450